MRRRHPALLLALIAFAAALGGVVVGRWLLPPPPGPGVALHRLLHDELRLDEAQRARVEALEAAFAGRKRTLEAQMRARNAELAAAIAAEHRDGPRVRAAIDRIHATMGTLQKETLAHVFAMRAVLRPDQAEAYDRVVVKALTDGAP